MTGLSLSGMPDLIMVLCLAHHGAVRRSVSWRRSVPLATVSLKLFQANRVILNRPRQTLFGLVVAPSFDYLYPALT